VFTNYSHLYTEFSIRRYYRSSFVTAVKHNTKRIFNLGRLLLKSCTFFENLSLYNISRSTLRHFHNSLSNRQTALSPATKMQDCEGDHLTIPPNLMPWSTRRGCFISSPVTHLHGVVLRYRNKLTINVASHHDVTLHKYGDFI